MTLAELKSNIESNTVVNTPIIFLWSDNTFVAHQYTNALAEINHKPVQFIQGVDDLLTNQKDIFGVIESVTTTRVLCVDKFICDNPKLSTLTDLIVIAPVPPKKAKKTEEEKKADETLQMFNHLVIEIPTLEPWQTKDYLYSSIDGLNEKSLDYLHALCGGDIYRLDMEIQKLKMFEKKQQQLLFDDMISENAFSDMTNRTTFDFVNAICRRNKADVVSIYADIDAIGINPMGLFALVYQNIRRMVLVKFNQNPSEENTGMKANQIAAVSRVANSYTMRQLQDVFDLVTSVDKLIKTGKLGTEYIIDYILIKVFAICLN